MIIKIIGFHLALSFLLDDCYVSLEIIQTTIFLNLPARGSNKAPFVPLLKDRLMPFLLNLASLRILSIIFGILFSYP